MTKMTDAQPAWMLRDKDETANVAAVTALLENAPRPTSGRIVEFFGGLGGVTRIAAARFPDVTIESWDRDMKCWEAVSAAVPTATVRWGDSCEEAQVRAGDGVLMDFNVLTLLRAQRDMLPVLRRVFEAKPDWVQIADSAVSKLHLNYGSYGLPEPSLNAYMCAWDDWTRTTFAYRLKAFQGHTRAQHLIFFPV